MTTTFPPETAGFLNDAIGAGWTAQPLAGDASYRQYFRIIAPEGASYILAWYPDEVRPEKRRFLDAYRAVSPFAFVAKIVTSDDAPLLQQDVVDQTLFN